MVRLLITIRMGRLRVRLITKTENLMVKLLSMIGQEIFTLSQKTKVD